MNGGTVHSAEPVLLVGGGDSSLRDIKRLRRLSGAIVAADGGAGRVLAAGFEPDAVIGDMDSIAPEVLARIASHKVQRISEQETTDFDKCLRSIEAPMVLGAGFLGARLDHQLSVQTVLVRYAHKPCLLLGRHDIVFVAPPTLDLTLPPGARMSLFPMRQVTGESSGLRWPIDGIGFAPDGRIGTSNEVTDGPVRLSVSGPGMLVIIPREALRPAMTALLTAARWPAP